MFSFPVIDLEKTGGKYRKVEKRKTFVSKGIARISFAYQSTNDL